MQIVCIPIGDDDDDAVLLPPLFCCPIISTRYFVKN